MATFSEQLREYIERAGISDAELARSIGVRRQTVFRWKEGIVERPRQREDVLRCAAKLRLTPGERDGLLVAAGFAPEDDGLAVVQIGPATQTAATEADIPDDAGAAPVAVAAHTFAPVPWPLWGLVGGFFVLIIALAMGWIRPGGAVVMPTPVAMPAVRAAAGETLVLVAEFANYAPDQSYNVAGRVVEAIEEEIGGAKLAQTRAAVWPEAVAGDGRAGDILDQSGAAMLIWGEYDSGRVRVNWATTEGRAQWEQLLPTPSELTAAINVDVPQQVKSIANLTLGGSTARPARRRTPRRLRSAPWPRPPIDAGDAPILPGHRARTCAGRRLGAGHRATLPSSPHAAARLDQRALQSRQCLPGPLLQREQRRRSARPSPT
ncbi:MAG: helix-turn-helix transcriptional regulator [Caldilineaceae bacterium]